MRNVLTRSFFDGGEKVPPRQALLETPLIKKAAAIRNTPRQIISQPSPTQSSVKR